MISNIIKDRKKLIIILEIVLLIILILFVIIFTNKKNNVHNQNIIDELMVDEIEANVIDMNNVDNVNINNNMKYNVSKKLNKNHYIENSGNVNQDIVVSDIELYASYEDEKTFFNAKITNNSDEEYEIFTIIINFLDKNGNIIYSRGYYVEDFKKNATRDINMEYMYDFSNAYDIIIYTIKD